MKHIYATTIVDEISPGAPLLLQGNLLQAVEKTAALGYQSIEIHIAEEPAMFPTSSIADACNAHQVRVAAIATGRVYTKRHKCITSPDPANRKAAMQELYSYVDIAADLKATDGVVIGWVKGKRPENAEGFDDLLAAQLRQLSAYAASKNQKLLIEAINRYETNIFNTCAELLDFLARYEIPNAYIHLDTFHMNIEERDPSAAILLAGNRLGYIHFADSNRLSPGSGHFNFVPVLKALKAIGYQGALSVECLPWPDGETAAKNSKAVLEKLWQEV